MNPDYDTLNRFLAAAMGADEFLPQCFAERQAINGDGDCLDCGIDAHESPQVPPDYAGNPAESRRLLAWINRQYGGARLRFMKHLCDLCELRAPLSLLEVLTLMAEVSPLTIAQAAELTIKETEATRK